MNTVVVVSGGLTETLQAAPLIAGLAEATDDPVLVACPATAADAARDLAGAGEVVPVPGLAQGATFLRLGRLWFELRRRRLDVAVVCSDSAAVRATVYAAAVPRRLGCRGGVSDILFSDRVRCEPGQNRSLVWLELCRRLVGGGAAAAEAQFNPGTAATTVAEQLLLSNGVEDGSRLLVAIAPGSGFSDSSVVAWSPERYAHLANRLASRHGAGVILVGDERDRDVAAAMRVDLASQTLDFCGELNLATTAAVIARCDLLVAADTPLLHVAAAVGTPSVGLFGPTSGRSRAPAGSEHRVVQAIPAGGEAASLERIRVDDVLAGIESAL
ncbi:MAG: glycosyltransferase family 9 protein [Candidatus Dormibacter sp.]